MEGKVQKREHALKRSGHSNYSVGELCSQIKVTITKHKADGAQARGGISPWKPMGFAPRHSENSQMLTETSTLD